MQKAGFLVMQLIFTCISTQAGLAILVTFEFDTISIDNATQPKKEVIVLHCFCMFFK